MDTRLTAAGAGLTQKDTAMPFTRPRHWLFSDYNIQNPSFAGFVTTQDHGLLEFLLVFSKA